MGYDTVPQNVSHDALRRRLRKREGASTGIYIVGYDTLPPADSVSVLMHTRQGIEWYDGVARTEVEGVR